MDDLLPAHPPGARHRPGPRPRRRLRPGQHPAHRADRPAGGGLGRLRGDHDRDHPAAADGRRGRAAASRWWRSTTPGPSGCSTTGTAPASPPSTGSCGPPTPCSRARPSWSPGSATAAGAWPSGPGAWARGWSSPRSTRSRRWTPPAGLRGAADGAGRHGGDVFITVTGNRDVIRARAPGGDEGRRDPRQRRPLRRRDRRPGAGRAGRRRCTAAYAPTPTSTSWPTAAGSCCSPRAGW